MASKKGKKKSTRSGGGGSSNGGGAKKDKRRADASRPTQLPPGSKRQLNPFYIEPAAAAAVPPSWEGDYDWDNNNNNNNNEEEEEEDAERAGLIAPDDGRCNSAPPPSAERRWRQRQQRTTRNGGDAGVAGCSDWNTRACLLCSTLVFIVWLLATALHDSTSSSSSPPETNETLPTSQPSASPSSAVNDNGQTLSPSFPPSQSAPSEAHSGAPFAAPPFVEDDNDALVTGEPAGFDPADKDFVLDGDGDADADADPKGVEEGEDSLGGDAAGALPLNEDSPSDAGDDDGSSDIALGEGGNDRRLP